MVTLRRPSGLLHASLVFVAVVALDQVSKGLVTANIARDERREILPGFDLVNIRNHGVAFGLFSNGQAPVIALTVIALVGLLAYFGTHLDRPFLWLPTGLLLGGAAGNLLDRLRGDAVVDFIDPPLWPAFNLADAAITIGVILLLYVIERNAPDRR